MTTLYRFVAAMLAGLCIQLSAGCEPLAQGRHAVFEEPHRPAYHFSPARNWMNDPNGLIYHEGEYHMFFQHNPHDSRWGRMSWGHAISHDLVNWTELPIAIPEREVHIYSGSTVIDWTNTSGLQSGDEPPMVAIYTGFTPEVYLESQYLSYSLDRGRTWREIDDNPILSKGRGHFRDPKVFWDAPRGRWVMPVVYPNERKVGFFVSANLKEWDEAGSFGPAGETGGYWETPELFPAPVEGGGVKWVLVVGTTEAGVAGGSGVQYFIGEFDGETFTLDPASTGKTKWVDYGADFYAPQTWGGIPEDDGRRISIAWFANTSYANDVPTEPWRGFMTVPRILTVFRAGDDLELRQQPIAELRALRDTRLAIGPQAARNGHEPLEGLAELGPAQEIVLTLHPEDARESGLVFHFGGRELRVGYDAAKGTVFVDRRKSGSFRKAGFAARHDAPVRPGADGVRLHILLDRSSIEVFVNDGERVISDLFFAPSPLTGVDLFARRGAARISGGEAWRLKEMTRGAASAAGEPDR